MGWMNLSISVGLGDFSRSSISCEMSGYLLYFWHALSSGAHDLKISQHHLGTYRNTAIRNGSGSNSLSLSRGHHMKSYSWHEGSNWVFPYPLTRKESTVSS